MTFTSAPKGSTKATTTAAVITPQPGEPLDIRFDPRSATLKIIHIAGITRVDLFAVTGTPMQSTMVCNEEVTLDVSGLRAGVYIIRISDTGRNLHSGKFIKN